MNTKLLLFHTIATIFTGGLWLGYIFLMWLYQSGVEEEQ